MIQKVGKINLLRGFKHMARFRCPRCGAVVEGLHDRCPRCNVLFKYRKEDVELLTPYKAQPVEQPERIVEQPAPEPLPPEPVKQEPVVVEEPKQPEPQPEPKPEPVPDYTKNNKAKSASLVFGILGFLFTFLFNWNLLAIIFGSVALGKAKKAKPIKATGGKVFGILALVFGIIGLLVTIAIIALIVLAALGVGVYFLVMNWDAVMGLFGGSSALALF